MLVGLLLLCLMAPRYWRSNDAADISDGTAKKSESYPNGATESLVGAGKAAMSFGRRPGGSVAENDPLNLWAAPTIEELIAARASAHRFEEPAFGWPVILPPATATGSDRTVARVAAPAAPGPRLTATFERVGRIFTQYSPLQALPRLTTKAVALYRLWSSQPIVVRQLQPPGPDGTAHKLASPAPSTLRLLGPEDGQRVVPPGQRSLAQQGQGQVAGPIVGDPWCVPQVLFDQLERLTRHPQSAHWAEQTIAQLHALTKRGRLEGHDVQTLLESLSDSAQEAVRMADDTRDDRLRVELLRAHWGLARRIDCWAVMHDIRIAELSRERFASRGSLGAFFDSTPSKTVDGTDEIAFTENLEAYERSRDPQVARRVVLEQRELESSTEAHNRSLADAVEQHYRNANVRIAVTAELLNRLVAQERSETQALRDRIAGTPVRGRSRLQSESRVRLDPATGRWQLTVEAEGVVDSNTLADGGRARVRSQSATDFTAHKSITVDPDGVRLQRTVVNASTHNRLMGVTTDFDWVPLLGSYARDRAVSEYAARRGRARAEVESKVSAQAVNQIDRETLDAVESIERQVRERFTDRLAEAGVDLTPVEMTTTQERMVARLRVAGDHQLGSHTPRPRALSDSLASVQVHETALTNAAVTLSLDGNRYTAVELQRLLREKLPSITPDGATRQEVAFHFAEQDAIQFYIADGRLEFRLALTSVEQDRRAMRDVIVHAYYVPIVNGLDAELVRDGSLGIEGRLSSAERARLHNVFNSVLPPERRLPLLRLDNSDDPRLEDLMITQLVLEDGWLGLAVGPASGERVAERSRSLR